MRHLVLKTRQFGDRPLGQIVLLNKQYKLWKQKKRQKKS